MPSRRMPLLLHFLRSGGIGQERPAEAAAVAAVGRQDYLSEWDELEASGGSTFSPLRDAARDAERGTD